MTGFRKLRFHTTAAGLILAACLSTGCGDSENTLVTSTLAATDNENGADAAQGMRLPPPTLAELSSLLNLTAEQSTVVAAALEKWQAGPPAGRGGPGGPPTGGPAGGRRRGPGGPGGGGFPGGGRPEGPRPGGEPVVGFVADVASVLDQQQFLTLVQFFVDRRANAMAGHEGDRREPGGDRVGGDLDLTEAQRTGLRDAFRAAADALHTLRKGIVEGTVSGEAIRTEAGHIRTTLVGTLQSLLGTEKFDRLAARVQDMRERMATMMLGEAGKHVDRHADVLGRLLGLSDTQKNQVKATLNGAVPASKALLERVKNGSIAFEDALYEGYQIESSTRSAIEAGLTADQTARLHALRELLARPQFLRVYF